MSSAYELAKELEELANTLKSLDFVQNQELTTATYLYMTRRFNDLGKDIKSHLVAPRKPAKAVMPSTISFQLDWDDGVPVGNYDVPSSCTIKELRDYIAKIFHVPELKIGLISCDDKTSIGVAYRDVDERTITLPALVRDTEHEIVFKYDLHTMSVFCSHSTTIAEVKAELRKFLGLDPINQCFDELKSDPDTATIYIAWMNAGSPKVVNISGNYTKTVVTA